MTSHLHRGRRRGAARLLTIGVVAAAMLAAPLATGPATADPPAPTQVGVGPADGSPSLSPDDRSAAVESVGCSASKTGFSGATGSCQNPSPSVDFRVVGLCRHSQTHVLYNVFSPIVSSSQTVGVFCGHGPLDPILNWDVQVFGEPDLPEIHSVTCQINNHSHFSCQTSASDWTSLTWRIDGKHIFRWNNHTSIADNCNIGVASEPTIEIEIRPVSVRVTASNAHGSTQKNVSTPECIVAGG